MIILKKSYVIEGSAEYRFYINHQHFAYIFDIRFSLRAESITSLICVARIVSILQCNNGHNTSTFVQSLGPLWSPPNEMEQK
jgi:hypothetical protein